MENQLATIYVIDDDRSMRRSLSALLKAHGYTTTTFESAEAYLASSDGNAGGCVIADVRMPGMSGLELQKQLARDRIKYSVILITGHGDIPMAVEAMKFGAVDFIEKPFAENVLLSAVERAIGSEHLDDHDKLPPAIVEERLARLTKREREVLDYLIRGEINKTIAHELNISQRTVEIHRARVKEKMEAQSLSDLIRMTR